jgi:hypothetical protein
MCSNVILVPWNQSPVNNSGVIPGKLEENQNFWIPAFAGMTMGASADLFCEL